MSLIAQTTDSLLSRLRKREASAVEVVTECLDQIDSVDDRVGAFLQVERDAALQQAADIDRRRIAGDSLGPLAGLPVAVKDNLCATGTLTTCASRMLEKFVPPYDAHVVERLRAADAVLIGKTNLDEFAMGSSCENSAFQKTHNPWNLERTPGG
ncbi:MAG: Asp-tRNA(Asn)/Glu-tRNA(Gln) amidotransferase GatCAB subunit A, partial [Planctomycetaceae bacterium]|nr:Asp-tRNA(Asn)/Glu-tRNA(Gln) amidotransferase GatCAB subunit A [Planctomycetaceae bacterium]